MMTAEEFRELKLMTTVVDQTGLRPMAFVNRCLCTGRELTGAVRSVAWFFVRQDAQFMSEQGRRLTVDEVVYALQLMIEHEHEHQHGGIE